MFAQIAGLCVGTFVHTIGDAHIYNNHIPMIKEQLEREPKNLPTLIMPKFKSLDGLLKTKPCDYILDGYEHHPTIKMEMAV
jgi:thymidylate synthase